MRAFRLVTIVAFCIVMSSISWGQCVPAIGLGGWLDSAVNRYDGSTTVSATKGAITVSGWAFDATSHPTVPPSKVSVFADGNWLGDATLGGSRPDVAAYFCGVISNSGWTLNATTDATFFSVGTHVITAVVYGSGQTFTTVSATVTAVPNAAPFGSLEQVTDARTGSATISSNKAHVSGWAADSEDGSPVASISITVDNATVANTKVTVASRTDVVTAYGRTDFLNSGFSTDIVIPSVAPGTHVVGVVATDSKGLSRKVGSQLVTFQ